MSVGHRLLVALVLAAIVAAPLAALHPISQHVFDSGQAVVPQPVRDAAAVAVLMLVGASVLPLLSLARIFRRWFDGSSELRSMYNAGTVETTDDGIEFVLLDAPQVVFFTAGFVRPRIFATSGARNYLSPGAFRAGLLHERAHQASRDIAWRAALAAIERAFSPFAPIREAVRSLSLQTEVAADRAALAAGAGRRELFDAMVAAAQGATAAPGVGLAAGGIVERLTVVVDPAAVQPSARTLPLSSALAALALLPLAVHTLFWIGAVCF